MKTRFSLAIAVLCIGVIALFGMESAGAAAQGDEGVEFDLMVVTVIREADFESSRSAGAWEGVTVTLVSADGTLNTTCVTAWWGGCNVAVPLGSTITVSIDQAAIPGGYYLVGEPVLVVEIPSDPLEMLYAWPYYEMAPLENTGEEEPQAEVPSDEPVIDNTVEADYTGEAVTAETTDAQGVEAVLSLPNTGTQAVASGATGMVHLLIAAAALMMAGVFGLRRRVG